jgi:hypothetical protein
VKIDLNKVDATFSWKSTAQQKYVVHDDVALGLSNCLLRKRTIELLVAREVKRQQQRLRENLNVSNVEGLGILQNVEEIKILREDF